MMTTARKSFFLSLTFHALMGSLAFWILTQLATPPKLMKIPMHHVMLISLKTLSGSKTATGSTTSHRENKTSCERAAKAVTTKTERRKRTYSHHSPDSAPCSIASNTDYTSCTSTCCTRTATGKSIT